MKHFKLAIQEHSPHDKGADIEHSRSQKMPMEISEDIYGDEPLRNKQMKHAKNHPFSSTPRHQNPLSETMKFELCHAPQDKCQGCISSDTPAHNARTPCLPKTSCTAGTAPERHPNPEPETLCSLPFPPQAAPRPHSSH